MDYPEGPVQRTVVKVYGRRRDRVLGGRANGLTIGSRDGEGGGTEQGESKEEEEGKGRSRTTAAGNVVTPPSTPARKRTSMEHRPSPAASSPSHRSPVKGQAPVSPSKVSIDKDVAGMFSPTGKRRTSGEQIGHDSEDEEDQLDVHVVRTRTKKPSFADRMAPRKRSRGTGGMAATGGDTTAAREERVSSPLPSESVLSSQPSSQERSVMMRETETPPIGPLSMPYKRYGRVGISLRKETALSPMKSMTDRCAVGNLESLKPCLKELSQRWAELDDMDEADEEPTIKTITGLRACGQNRRFQEDFQYLVLDLSASQSLSVRRGTCVEIAKRIVSADEKGRESEEGDASQTSQPSKPPESTILAPFLTYIKQADLVNPLWAQLRDAGAGRGEDEVLDSVLALVCMVMVQSDAALALVLSRQSGFNTCLATMMSSSSHSITSRDTHGRKCMAALYQLRASGLGETFSPAAIALETVASLANLNDSPINIAQIAESGTSIAAQMWTRLGEQARLTGHQDVHDSGHPDGVAVALIAQTFVGCASQVGSKAGVPHPPTSPTDVVLLLRHFALSDVDSRERRLEPLCSLLRMLIALMASDGGSSWSASILCAENTIDTLVQLVKQGADEPSTGLTEGEQANHLDLLALALALLTDFLAQDSRLVRKLVLASPITQPGRSASAALSPIAFLGQLLQQQKEREEADASAGYLVGSLAVVLALLIVGKESRGESDGGKEQDMVLEQLAQGSKSGDSRDSVKIILAALDEFAAMMLVVSKTYNTELGKRKKGQRGEEEKEGDEDQAFFHHLSSSLSVILSSTDCGGELATRPV